MSSIEEKKNKLNLEIRELLSIIDMIDGKTYSYPDYKENTMGEELFLEQQLEIVKSAKNRLIDIFR